ncbi:MAG TPA: M1 family metallopeptidase [Bryobacteraceae bacterium]|nr:M1 family metallopeptidase [Bryobacteraceae bacterium]
MPRATARLPIPLLFALALCADTYPRQFGIDARHYTFSITLRDDTDEISGQTAVALLFVQSGITQVSLDLADNMLVTGVVSTQPLTYTHAQNKLAIALVAPAAGERRTFTITYRGKPAGGLRIGRNKYGERTFFSSNWPDRARQWLPMIDHPYDKATSEFLITTPDRYAVVANGALKESSTLSGARRMTHWKESAPIASWLNAIAVAPFDKSDLGSIAGISLQTWLYPRDRDIGAATLDAPMRQAAEFYAARIGPYSYEKLAGVEAAGVDGGMEHASEIFFDERLFGAARVPGIVAHEVAHQWFGDAVTEKDWDDVWLSEGFATYFALLELEREEGHDPFIAALKRSRTKVFAAQKEEPREAVIHRNLSDMNNVLNDLVYEKGGWALHMLRAQTGDEAFWRGIREYYRLYRNGNASTDDFRAVMEGAAHTDLKWFFHQWLERAGAPVVAAAWQYDPATRRIELDLEQTQSGIAYRLPLEISIDGKIEKIEMENKRQHFTIGPEKEPRKILLDPNTLVLMQSTLLP